MSDVFFPAHSFEPQYLPEVGLFPYEVSRNVVHPGTEIFNVIDTSNMGQDDILNQLSSLDQRMLNNMPQEVMDEIKAGNITHIFQTDPSSSSKYADLTSDLQESIQGKGSIYVRTKEGKTARWKLPEISDGDAGWNANKGNSIFMDQAIYSNQENIRSISGAENLRKGVDRGQRAAETVDEKILNTNIYDEVMSETKTITGAGTGVAPQPTKTVPQGTRKPVAKPSAEPTVKVGRPVKSDSSTAATVTKSGNATPQKAVISSPSVQAKVSSTPTKAVSSSGAPVKNASKLRSMADDTSAAVVKGAKNANNLKMMALASAVGLGAAAYGGIRKTQQDNIDRRLEMQRQGIIR